MTTPENTTQRDSAIHLLGAMSEGLDGYITGMEAAGQAQLVHSEALPSEGPWDDLIALGFTKGEPVAGDDLFVTCTLPEGWTKAPTDHAMWSKVRDERGVERVSVFYKAAFYDRKAFCRIANPGYSLATDVLYGDGPVALPEVWDRLTEEERGEFWRNADDMAEKVAEYPDIYQDRAQRVTDLLALR